MISFVIVGIVSVSVCCQGNKIKCQKAAYFRAFCKVGIIVRSLAESSVFLYGNISTFRSDWREIEYRRIAVGFRLWIRCQRL